MNKIENDKELEITRAWIRKFERNIADFYENQDEYAEMVDPRIAKAVLASLISQVEDLKEQVRVYLKDQYKGC